MPAKALKTLAVPRSARPQATLGGVRKGARGVVVKVGAPSVGPGGLEPSELERRLLEDPGFVEGARFELIHEGLFRARSDRGEARGHDRGAAPP